MENRPSMKWHLASQIKLSYWNEIQYQRQKSKSQVDVSKQLNTFFVTEIGTSLIRNVKNVNTTYEEFYVSSFVRLTRSSSLRKRHLHMFFILLSNLCKFKATGLDKISAKLLRKCTNLIAKFLTNIFHQTMLTGFCWWVKSARVTKKSGKSVYKCQS